MKKENALRSIDCYKYNHINIVNIINIIMNIYINIYINIITSQL